MSTTRPTHYAQNNLQVETRGRGIIEITQEIKQLVSSSLIKTGLCHLFIQHTSASLIVCENADPDVRVDLETFMSKMVPDGDPMFIHTAEGKDDMPAHVRSVLTQTDLTVPVVRGALALGTWQGVYLWEHRTSAHRRNIIVTLHGEY